MVTALRARLDAAFAPVWAGPWALSRGMFVFAAAWSHLWRVAAIRDAYAVDDMVFTSGPFRLADFVIWTPATATALWAVGVLGIGMIGWGGRALRPGLVLWFVGAWALLAEEAVNIKAHDRLMFWVAVGLMLSPAGERGLVHKARGPVARWYLVLVFSAIYGSTGLMKLLHEPGWLDGTALQYHLVHRFHAGGPLALWVSGQRWLTTPMGWWTLVFELGFPFFVWSRRANPVFLAMGALFHLGILSMMNVGPFSAVSLSMYPVLLHPEVAAGLWTRARDRWVSLRS